MKVLYLMNTTIMGGGNISFINMLRGLQQQGVKCYAVYPDRQIDPVFQKQAEGIIEKFYWAPLRSYVHDDISYYRGYRKLKKSIKAAIKSNSLYQKYRLNQELKALDTIVEEAKPDIIHTNVGVIHAGYYISQKYHIPHVWHLREYQTKDFHWIIEPSFDQFVSMLHQSYVVTITQDILKYFQLEDYSDAQCIYNGCFSKKDVALEFPKEQYFLCCSRISEEKGHTDVVRAFSEFHKDHPEYRLKIAGFGDERYIAELKEIATTSNCINAIDFLGFQKDVKPLMGRARALLVASRFEGFGRMTAEAAFCGCVVIGNNTGGTKEILDITGGFPYENGVSSLHEKMCKVAELSDDQYRQKVVHAQKQAVDNFSNESNVEQIYSLYKKIVEKDHK